MHRNLGAVLLLAILSLSVLLLNVSAQNVQAPYQSGSVSSDPCLSASADDYYYLQDVCGSVNPPPQPILQGNAEGIGFSTNTSTYACGPDSYTGYSGCSFYIVLTPPGVSQTIYTEFVDPLNSATYALYDTNYIPLCSSLTGTPTQQCIAAEITNNPNEPASLTATIPSTYPAGTYIYDAYVSDTPQGCGTCIVAAAYSSGSPAAPYWVQTYTVTISASTGSQITGQVNLGAQYILPGASTNITVNMEGLPSGEASQSVDFDTFYVITTNTVQPNPPPSCPTSITPTSPAPCGGPGVTGTNCWADWANTYDEYTSAGTGMCQADANGDGGKSCQLYGLETPANTQQSYNVCIYYAPSYAGCGPPPASVQCPVAPAPPTGGATLIPASPGPLTVTTYAAGYGIYLTSNPVNFPLGNTTVITASATQYYKTYPGASPDICNNALPFISGGGTPAYNDECFIEFAGQIGAPGTTCVQPTLNSPGDLAYPYSSGYSQQCPNIYDVDHGIPDTCYLTGYSGTTYQNHANTTFSEPLNSQYLPNGQYLLCFYNYQPISYFYSYGGCGASPNGCLFSPYFGSATVTCVNGICGTIPTKQPFVIPPCQGCGLSNSGGVVGAYNAFQLNSFKTTACGIYSTLDIILLLFALVLLLLGAVLYAGSTILPAQTRGVAQSYAFGFILVGVIAFVIGALSVWALSIGGQVSIATVLNYCA